MNEHDSYDKITEVLNKRVLRAKKLIEQHIKECSR